jgi:fucose permease
MRKIEKIVFLILVLIDPILKIVFIIILNTVYGTVNNSNKGLAFILEGFFVIQYCVLSFVFFLTYCAYFWANIN